MKFTIKQIAAQAGVSKATVDRALHNRGAVHAQTQRKINQAIRDLELQEITGQYYGRTIPIDVIMHTTERFSRLVLKALTDEMFRFAPFKLSLRFHSFETISSVNIRKLMLKCASDSYGVILKAENNPLISDTINELQKHRVPVLTMVTDIPESQRLCYVGMNNYSAGRTAAYLTSRWLRNSRVDIAVVQGSRNFLGEDERVEGFCLALKEMAPNLNPVIICEGYGIDNPTYLAISQALKNYPDLAAVYCVGGGNIAIRRAFKDAERNIEVHIGHDVDEENKKMLEETELDAVIQHDLHHDARVIFETLLTFHSFLPAADKPAAFSSVGVITPFNI